MSTSSDQRVQASSQSPDSARSKLDQHFHILLSSLETNLQETQEALLARDLPRFEQLTHQQFAVEQELASLWRKLRSEAAEPGSSSVSPVRDLAARVLALGCVQQALLRRAQHSLRVVANLMAGPDANYAPFSTLPATCRPNLVSFEEA